MVLTVPAPLFAGTGPANETMVSAPLVTQLVIASMLSNLPSIICTSGIPTTVLGSFEGERTRRVISSPASRAVVINSNPEGARKHISQQRVELYSHFGFWNVHVDPITSRCILRCLLLFTQKNLQIVMLCLASRRRQWQCYIIYHINNLAFALVLSFRLSLIILYVIDQQKLREASANKCRILLLRFRQ